MAKFMDEDFLLSNDIAKELFAAVKDEPIIDFHNHLNPREIYEDRCFDNMAEVWLGGDHYKWRAMRANGISEKLITGDGAPFDKFLAWADTVQNLIGNPLYHWTHLELQRYFGITKPLSPETAEEIWNECNAKLKTKEFSVRNLLRMQNVSVLCTTDDPADDLEWHRKIREDGFEIKVCPSFRPEKAIGIEKDGFVDYINNLSLVVEFRIDDTESLLKALELRLEYFIENGCRVSDHSLESLFFVPTNKKEVDEILKIRMAGVKLSEEQEGKFRGYMLTELGRLYAKHDIVMQLHIGAIRNNSERFFRMLGPDTGFDALNDFNYAPQLAALLSAMDLKDELPKTILYCLNPKDTEMLAAMAGTFCSNENGIKGKVQLGAAWWFCDHKNGMERQIEAMSDSGLISTSVGMLTDSRSFLSFPRHELYRRILCNKIGSWVENGEYPKDDAYLRAMVKRICGTNAVDYFKF
ncbi:glucuronate isomerase [Pseudobutyrivibrio xylanivorans]|uniref:Uronate isomerase n=1 Tax=Pseudobutyrivibrio xylanivorans TaxID=185007 RepID=A0A5P6VMF0_PSEXY|nr:glucuronate isomerase [Pseudobutyrivibrio xylanivorans]QFJ53835.1 glucuronate isomerase [Pseudobutyrivibrio xylanivorans]